ncbi:MAG: hypothetical protein RL226_2323 [Bacteroidota bacterium]
MFFPAEVKSWAGTYRYNAPKKEPSFSVHVHVVFNHAVLLFVHFRTFALKFQHVAQQLPVMEQFYTIQGEGEFTGSPAWFIRLGGCDVGCFWCDVKESWDADAHPKWSVEQLVEEAVESGAPIAVITGGEPCMHNLDALTAQLQAKGIRTHLETSGAHPLTGSWNWICLSPKKFKPVRQEFYAVAHELKIVVYNKHDLQWAEGHRNAVDVAKTLCFLQPEWEEREENLPMILNHIRENPMWKLSLQTHKYIGIP